MLRGPVRRAVRVYLMYAVGLLVVFALVALLGQVLSDGAALFGGFLLAVLLAVGGAGWSGLRRQSGRVARPHRPRQRDPQESAPT